MASLPPLQAHRLAHSHFDDGSDHGDKLLGLTTKFLSPLRQSVIAVLIVAHPKVGLPSPQ
jgi:hypothetical protein